MTRRLAHGRPRACTRFGGSGLVRRAMGAVPMPIVMGMVAGVFLRFGLDLVRALHGDAALAAPMLTAPVPKAEPLVLLA